MKDGFGQAWDLLFHPAIAHRGLWSPDGPPENSLGAFQAACAAGYGIELDVQLSADGEAVVFHDDKLKRMTGREGRVRDFTEAPKVVNAASELFGEAFGDAGRHARSAVGVYRLPMNFAVEVDAVVQVR